MAPLDYARVYECETCRCRLEAKVWSMYLAEKLGAGWRFVIAGCLEPKQGWCMFAPGYQPEVPPGAITHELHVENLEPDALLTLVDETRH